MILCKIMVLIVCNGASLKDCKVIQTKEPLVIEVEINEAAMTMPEGVSNVEFFETPKGLGGSFSFNKNGYSGPAVCTKVGGIN